MSDLTEAQRVGLALYPKITGLISIICSTLIVFSILLDRRKRSKIHMRIVLGMSLIDISNSLTFGLSTWPIQQNSNVIWSIGNDTFCEAQGYFVQFGISASLYNSMLALYYLLVLRNGWTEEQVLPLEPFMHTLPPMWGFATATIGISLKLYNNSNLWCWIANFPSSCVGDECIRGQNATFYRYLFYYGPLWVNILFVTIAMILVFRRLVSTSSSPTKEEVAIQQQQENDKPNESKEEKEEKNEKQLVEDEALLDAMDKCDKRTIGNENYRKVQRIMALQCFLYSASFYIVWAPLTVVRLKQALQSPISYQLIATAAFMAPLQGLFNFMAFFFPRYYAVKHSNPSGGIGQWIKDAM